LSTVHHRFRQWGTFHGISRAVAALVLGAVFTGCAVSLVAPYDEIFDRQLGELQLRTDVFLAQMNATRGSYSANRSFYPEAFGTVEALRARAEVYGAAKNKGTLTELDALAQAFRDLQEYHEAGPVVGDGYQAIRNTIDVHFRALLQIELHKKHSAAVGAPTTA
jgi:hypothetical protein